MLFLIKWLSRLIVLGVLFYILLYFAMTNRLPSVDSFEEDYNTNIKNCKIIKIRQTKDKKIKIICKENQKKLLFKLKPNEIFFIRKTEKEYPYLTVHSILKEENPKIIIEKITNSNKSMKIYKIYDKNDLLKKIRILKKGER